MTEESNQFPIKVMTLSIEILTILYSRDLTHEELVQFKKRFSDVFDEHRRAQFGNYPADSIQHMETKIRNELSQFNEMIERERRERVNAAMEKICYVCRQKTQNYKIGMNEEVYCTQCAQKYLPNDKTRMAVEHPVN